MDVAWLSTSPLFGGLETSTREAIGRALIPLEVEAGNAAALQGEPADELYLVREGRLEAVQRDIEYGLEYRGETLGMGDDIGVAAAWLEEAYTATARAIVDSQLVALTGARLRELAATHADLGAALLTTMAERHHREQTRIGATNVDLARVIADEGLWSLLPRHVLTGHRVLPLARQGGVLVVGFVDPGNLAALDDIRRLVAGTRVRPVPMDAESFERFYRVRVAPTLDRFKPEEREDDRWFSALQDKRYDTVLADATRDASAPVDGGGKHVSGDEIVRLTNRLVGEALDLSASDIHVEPGERYLVVRYRVDGRLKKRPEPLPMRFHSPIVSRFKVLGRMDIADRRRAQDGRLAIAYGSREIDFRLSTVPTRYGEKIVLRILDPSSILVDLERLIPDEGTYRAVRGMVHQPQGMIIAAGPTGSGKTTTIYSALLRLREDEVNIVTIEDPIEYTIGGVAQVQVNEAAGITFATAVRHFLRQDPDIILVGETRDPLTAATSIEAALTGHLVFTTLHANDAVGAIVRLREMGVESFLIANTVIGVISQRLVRRLCPRCAVPATYHRHLIQPLGLFEEDEGPDQYRFYRGAGCVHCNFQGFRGRTGVFETLRIDERLRPLVAAGASTSELRATAVELGQLRPLRNYCRYLLSSGITTPEEVMRVLFIE